MTEFWTRPRILAAQLLAEDRETDVAIAALIGKSRKWLSEQKLLPEFKERVRTIGEELAASALANGIANQQVRLAEQNERWLAMIQVRKERAASMAGLGVTGAGTGLITRDYKHDTYVYEVDAGLLSEQLKLEAQVAKELGQSKDREKQGGGTTIVAGTVNIIRNTPELGL